MSDQKQKDKQDKREFTTEDKLAYFIGKRAWWSRREARFLTASKKAHAKKRIAYYDAKIAAMAENA